MPDSSATPSRVRLALAASTPSVGDDGVPDAAVGNAPPQLVVLQAEGGHEIVIEATTRLTLRVGASSLTLDADGTILLHGVRVTVAADEALTTYSAGSHTIRGAAVDIN